MTGGKRSGSKKRDTKSAEKNVVYFEHENPEHAFPDLVHIHYKVPENSTSSELSLILGATFGSQTIDGTASSYSVRLKRTLVRLRVTGFLIVEGTKWRKNYTEDQFAQNHKTVRTENNGRDSSFEFGASGKGRVVPFVKAMISDTFRTTEQNTVSLTRQPAVKIVEEVPAGWRIGDEIYGDPRHYHQCLDGPYFRDDNGHPQTACRLESLGSGGTLEVAVTARLGDLRVELLGSSRKVSKDDEAEVDRQFCIGAENLRDKWREWLAGAALLKQMAKRQAVTFSADGEYYLSIGRIAAHAEAIEEEDKTDA